MRRTTLGILAVFLLVVGIVVALRGPEDGSAAGFAGGCVRVGLILAALWLAWPQIMAGIKRLPGWAVGWFAKGNQQQPKRADVQPKDVPPPAPVKRPRRRSNS
jgi:hypothetical protein